MIIPRPIDQAEISSRLKNNPVTALLGPRQCGKTTLARQFKAAVTFDLENPEDLARLENPLLALQNQKGLIVIDEIQRRPELFPVIRSLVDNHPDQTYLILGSASRDLIRQGSESLAGRISFFTLSGFRHTDFESDSLNRLWLRGGFPRSFLTNDEEISFQWRMDYIATFLERDIPNLGIRIPAHTLRRFWLMISHYHGQLLNLSELGRSFGIADTTIRHYLDILQGTFMVRLLYPWHTNIGKRIIKRPKLYLRDSGIFHALQNIKTEDQLTSHPKLGASWEGFALETVFRTLKKSDEEIFFWATHSGAEVDLYWQEAGKNWACEFKYTDAPRLTRSMVSAVESLDLERLTVVYPGGKSYDVHEKVHVMPLRDIETEWDYQ